MYGKDDINTLYKGNKESDIASARKVKSCATNCII